jgi:uncharacterized membrane protein
MAGAVGTMMAALIGLSGVIVGLPLARGRVPRNHWYGYRIRRTLASDAVWYPVNALTGRWLSIGGAIVLLGALVSLPTLGDHSAQLVVLWLTLAFTAIGLAVLFWKGWRLARELDQANAPIDPAPQNRAT